MNAPEITTLSTREAYRNRWLRLREDRIRRADGTEGIYGVLEKPDFAIVIPQEADGSLHLVEQFRYPIGRRLWEVPQGAWETRPDTDPAVLARAELREETGLEADELTPLGTLWQGPGHSTQRGFVFLARGLHPGEAAHEPEEQGMIVRRFAFADVLAMMRDGGIEDAMTLAAIGMYLVRYGVPRA